MSACIRLPEVEAAKDGRGALDPAHLSTCAACQAEAASLLKLSLDLSSLRTALPVDRDALARAREVVLSSALVPRRAIRWQRLAVAAAVLVVSGVGAMVAFERSAPTPETRIQATDEGAARWTIDSRNDSEAITLTEGTLRLSVTRPTNGKQVVVHVPDGTIEDIGTVFHVVVANGATQEVRVDQGAVRLSLTGFGVVEVHAGEHWSRLLELAKPGSIGQQPAAEGDDSRDGEDSAYLLVIRSLREGSSEAAAEAARAYLAKYPRGFRAREVEAVLRPEAAPE